MAQEDLIPLNKRTKEEQKKLAIRGGKASGEARRAKRDLKANLKLMADLESEKLSKELRKMGQDKLADQMEEVGLIAFKYFEILNKKSVKMETRLKALSEISDRIDGKPTQRQEVVTPEGESVNVQYQGLLPATADLLAKSKAERVLIKD